MAKRYEVVKPKSLANPEYADFEYLIRWIGSDGSDYLYLFYDAELMEGTKTDVINQQSATTLKALLGDDDRKITLTASDLTKNDLTVFVNMMRNQYVTRLNIDGTTERYAVDGNSFKYRLTELRYNITFDVIPYSRPQWK